MFSTEGADGAACSSGCARCGTRPGRPSLEVGDVGKRVQVIATFAGVPARRSTKPTRSSRRASRVDARCRPRRATSSCARASRRTSARRRGMTRAISREHRQPATARKVLEHVKRVALVEGRRRQTAGARRSPSTSPGAVGSASRGERRRDVDADERRRRSRDSNKRPPAAAAEVDDPSPGPGCGASAAASTGGHRPAAAPATRSRGAQSACSASSSTSSAR